MSKSGQENHSNYMDGLKVKISEKYKPPPRINLAMTYSQRISLNKQLQDNMPVYDFALEGTIKEKMKEWRMARNLIAVDHKEKLDRIKEERRKRAEEILKREEQLKLEQTTELANQRIMNENDINQISNLDTKQNYTSGGVLIPTQVTTNNYGSILTPIPLSSQTSMCKSNEKSPINISDFEPDTCSPFDKVELNSINDLEELKLVLQNDDNKRTNATQPNFAVGNNMQVQSYEPRHETHKYYGYSVAHGSNQSYPVTSVYSNGFNYYTPDTLRPVAYNTYNYNTPAKTEYSGSYDVQTPNAAVDNNKLPFRSVPDIMKALQSQLSNTHVSNINIPSHSSVRNTSPSHGGVPEDSSGCEDLENPYEQLSRNMQEVCKQICLMGFPLSRVARACKGVGGDDGKKIIEHLLVMSQLLDLGFSEKRVSSALLQCNNDRDKALELLIS